MSFEDTIGYHDPSDCIVCGKGLRPGEALAIMHHEEHKLPICCPLCLEKYQQDPKQYWDRFARRVSPSQLPKPGDAPPGQS